MKLLKALFTRAAVWFTVLSLATLLFGLLFLPDQEHVSSLSFLLFFPFSLAASGAGLLWTRGKLSAVPRYFLHYLIFLAAFLLFILLPSGSVSSVPFLIVAWLLFTVLWWISRGAVHILIARREREK